MKAAALAIVLTKYVVPVVKPPKFALNCIGISTSRVCALPEVPITLPITVVLAIATVTLPCVALAKPKLT